MSVSMRLFLFFILALAAPCLYAEDEIFVQLSGETDLLPLYVSPIESKAAALTAEQQKALRDTLVFDLNYNGMTRVLTALKASTKGQEAFDAPANFPALKNDGILYLVKLRLEENKLSTKVIFVNGQTSRTIDGITLSGDERKDRAKMHALSDIIHELLFGTKGIASSKILYTLKKRVDRPNQAPLWHSEVYEADYDGHNARQITREGALCANPQYLPNHNGSILYVSYKIGQPKLYTIPLSGGTPQRVTSLRANQLTPAVSRDGHSIAFSSDITGKADIFYQAQNAKPRQIFTAKASANASPTFSPDGKKIAFASNKDGSPKIYVMSIPPMGAKLADVKVTLISKRCRENTAPCWSADGKKLAYCARNGGDRQIWIYDFETNQERELTKGPGIKENPSWAPDSLHLLFNATVNGSTDLYLINLNQAEAVKITSGPGAKLFPCWEPARK